MALKAKKVPLRTCVATGQQCPKPELLRIVKTPEGSILIDPTGKAHGRGAYIKCSIEAAQIAKNKHVFNRHFECAVPETFYDELIAYVSQCAPKKDEHE